MGVIKFPHHQIERYYSYSKDNHFRKINVKRWPLYIAKTGHKWYPIESVDSGVEQMAGIGDTDVNFEIIND